MRLTIRPSVQQPVSCLCAPLPPPPCVSVIEQVNVYRFFCGITSAINVLAALEEREFTFENKA